MTDFLVKHFVKNYTDTEDIKVRENYGTMAGITGIVCNIFLFVLKFAVGTLSGPYPCCRTHSTTCRTAPAVW